MLSTEVADGWGECFGLEGWCGFEVNEGLGVTRSTQSAFEDGQVLVSTHSSPSRGPLVHCLWGASDVRSAYPA